MERHVTRRDWCVCFQFAFQFTVRVCVRVAFHVAVCVSIELAFRFTVQFPISNVMRSIKPGNIAAVGLSTKQVVL